jgi:hypothetical protein
MSTRSSFDGARQRTQPLYSAAARYLGLSPQALRSQLEAGKSLAEIAAAQGKSVDGLKNFLLGALTGAGPTGGDPEALVDRLVNAHQVDEDGEPLAEAAPGPSRPADPVESTIADYLGLSPDQVRQYIAEGQSLSEIATAQGKDTKELKQALIGALQSPGGYAFRGQADALVDRLLNARGATKSISTVA